MIAKTTIAISMPSESTMPAAITILAIAMMLKRLKAHKNIKTTGFR